MRFPRASGVLLHPTSLPGPFGSGDLGPEAYHFVDGLVSGGQRLWQVLPLAGIGPGSEVGCSRMPLARGNRIAYFRCLLAGRVSFRSALPPRRRAAAPRCARPA